MLFNIITTEMGHKPIILDKTRAVLFLWRAIRDVADKLVWFAQSVNSYGFAEKMFNAINQLRSSMVDFDTIEKNAKTEITRKKMHDIAIINRRYRELIAEHIDTGGMLSYLIDNAGASKLLRETALFVCGFDHLSPQRLCVLEHLVQHAHSTMIGVQSKGELESQIMPTETHEIKQKINHVIPKISKHKNVNDEAVYLGNKIRGLLNGGVPPTDIVVLLCDYKNTAKIFAQTFAQNNIAVNMDVGVDLLETPIAAFVTDMVQLCQYDRAENLLAVLKSPFVLIEQSELFAIEGFCIKTNAGIKRVHDEFGLGKIHVHIKALAKQKTVKKISETILTIISEFVDPAGLSIDEGKIFAKSRERVSGLLETTAELIGDMKMNAGEFLQLFSTLCNSTSVSIVPTFANRVMVANAAEYQSAFVPHIFIANTTEATFPATGSDTQILTEFDIKHMDRVRIEPTVTMQNKRARTAAFNIMTSATTGLHISHVATSAGGEEGYTSDIIEKILKKYPKSLENDLTINSRHFATSRVLSAITSGMAFTDPVYYNSLLVAAELNSLPIVDLSRVQGNIANGRELFFPKGHTSPSTVETFYACPYKNFLERGLKLRARPRYRVGADVMGTLIHRVVELYTQSIVDKKEQSIEKVLESVLQEREFSYFATDPINRPLVENLRTEVIGVGERIKQGIADGPFAPIAVERGLEEQRAAVKLFGKVDRIDMADNMVMVVDYKTGSNVKFSERDLANGTKVQLPLYLGMAAREYNAVPHGAVYFPISAGYDRDTKPKGIFVDKHPIGDMMDYAGQMVDLAAKHMSDGYIQCSRVDANVCGYCVYGALCQHRDKARGGAK